MNMGRSGYAYSLTDAPNGVYGVREFSYRPNNSVHGLGILLSVMVIFAGMALGGAGINPLIPAIMILGGFILLIAFIGMPGSGGGVQESEPQPVRFPY